MKKAAVMSGKAKQRDQIFQKKVIWNFPLTFHLVIAELAFSCSFVCYHSSYIHHTHIHHSNSHRTNIHHTSTSKAIV